MEQNKLQKILSYQIPTNLLNYVLLVLAVLMGIYLFVWNVESIVYADSIVTFHAWLETKYFWYAYGTLALVWGVLYCMTGNLFVSYVIMEIITFGWGIANNITWNTRKQFISLTELKLMNEAANVSVDVLMWYHPMWTWLIIIGVMLGIGLYFVYNRNIHKKNKAKNIKLREKIVTRIVGIIVLTGGFTYTYAVSHGIMIHEINPFKKTGEVVWFCQSLFTNTTADVSQEDVIEICDDFRTLMMKEDDSIVSEKRPNIIVIMSEAFWDTNHLNGSIETNINPMDKYYKLTENAINGEVAVNVYGGGTGTTEFEFLTGLNSADFSDVASHYRYFYSKPQKSLVSYMGELGYYTMALHPYKGHVYSREDVYPNMGFNSFYTYEEFLNKEKYHGYISDASLTKEIIARFEEQKEEEIDRPIFSFSVSVQNHVLDLWGEEEVQEKDTGAEIVITYKDTTPSKDIQQDIEEYYNGINLTMNALKDLIDYFEQYEEDTMIVFFGDHAPSFADMLCDIEEKEVENSLYKVPYMIWTNYENNYPEYGDMNISYLPYVLIEYLGLPKTREYYVYKYLLLNYPINTKYEQCMTDELDNKNVIDSLQLSYFIYNHYPKEENIPLFWRTK